MGGAFSAGGGLVDSDGADNPEQMDTGEDDGAPRPARERTLRLMKEMNGAGASAPRLARARATRPSK